MAQTQQVNSSSKSSSAADVEALHRNPKDFTEPAVPEGFERRTGDLAGYWEPTTYDENTLETKVEGCPAIVFTPLHCTLSDSKVQQDKTSVLIHCRLEEPGVLRSANKDEGRQVYPAGTLFGIWAKTDMQPLKKLAGVKVYMKNDGCKRIKVGQKPMAKFDIQDPGPGEKLPISEDHRKFSLPEAEQRRRFEAKNSGEVDADDEFIPF